MTDRTINEFRNAELVPNQGGSNAYLVRFGEEDYEMVNKTGRNRLLLETDLLEAAEDGDLGFTEDSDAVLFEADLEADEYVIRVEGDDDLPLPSEYEEEALTAYVERDWDELYDLYYSIMSDRVRVDVVSDLTSRFSDDQDRIETTRDGWVIDDAFVVRWDAENYLTEEVEQHRVDGGDTVEIDETRQARVLNFPELPDSAEVENRGETLMLTNQELQFLATVECLLDPEEYLSDDEAERVEELSEWGTDPIAAAARSARVEGFTDEKSGLYHGHGLYKHTLDMLGVTDEAMERLFYNSFDHAGVHELRVRQDEFENAPYEVFADAPNTDSEKWEKIAYTSEQAPIPQHVRSDINERFV